MKYITLTNSMERAKVDDEDFEFINQYEWHLTDKGYAGTYINGRLVLMQNMVWMMMQAEKERVESN